MTSSPFLFSLLRLFLLLLSHRNILTLAQGRWDLLHTNVGISAMHMQLLHTDRVIILDRTDFGPSNISLPNGRCRDNPNDKTLTHDCTAHSVEYDVSSNTVRPLFVQTDTWCSSAAVMSDGTLVQTGGWNDGERHVRKYQPCSNNSCDWQEVGPELIQKRWYAANHILPDGRQIIIGGSWVFTYEFYPKTAWADKAYNLPFLVETSEPGTENNLYPFVFLNVDGNLFIFANNRAILFDFIRGVVVKNYPIIPTGDGRSYPTTGSAVLLPLRSGSKSAEVLVCGGAPKEAFGSAWAGNFMTALNTCGRIQVNDPSPQWTMETMPAPRVMGDMILLPNGNVLIINGGESGVATWELGRDPIFTPVMYRPNSPYGSRFEVQIPSSRPRMYHSCAILLRDGRVLVGGSNPHERDTYTGVLFPTDLTLEAFSPPYLDPNVLRPRITWPVSQSIIWYNQQLVIGFYMAGQVNLNSVMVTMVLPPFTTHSFSMNQRLLILNGWDVKPAGAANSYQIRVATPDSRNLAPPGYYLLFVVHEEIPSEGIWVRLM